MLTPSWIDNYIYILTHILVTCYSPIELGQVDMNGWTKIPNDFFFFLWFLLILELMHSHSHSFWPAELSYSLGNKWICCVWHKSCMALFVQLGWCAECKLMNVHFAFWSTPHRSRYVCCRSHFQGSQMNYQKLSLCYYAEWKAVISAAHVDSLNERHPLTFDKIIKTTPKKTLRLLF